MILSDEAIRSAVRQGALGIAPFEEENLKSASYTFTLASRLLVPEPVPLIVINGARKEHEAAIGPEGYILQPGGFVLGFTAEHLSLKGKHACFLGTRGSCAQAGLSVLLSSSFAEPDTDNSIILEIHNASNSPIKLEAGMKIVKGIFVPVD